MRPDEEYAQRLLIQELGLSVEQHDDGTQGGMYDFRIGPSDHPAIAIECVRAANPRRMETVNVVERGGPIRTTLVSDWAVGVGAASRRKDLEIGLPKALELLAASGLARLRVDSRLEQTHPELFKAFDKLEVNSIVRIQEVGTGLVYPVVAGRAFWSDPSGQEVPSWLGAFLANPAQKDVLHKLILSGARSKYVFISVSLYGAPAAVESYLLDDSRLLPSAAPALPDEIDSAWLIHELKGAGVRWDRQKGGWRIVPALDQTHGDAPNPVPT